VLDFLGSLCPITLGHVQSVVEAHEILTGKATPLTDKAFQVFDGCVALISVNNDSHVSRKLASEGEAAMSRVDRLKLCELATAEYPWIHSDVDFHKWLQGLQRKFDHLDFVVWHLNGADDVSKYSKWNDARADSRYITMGRPGYTQEVLDGMRKSRASSEHFIVGREIPVNISSTEARAALTRRDMAKLATLLHPSVTAWCLTQGPWRDTNPLAAAAQQTAELRELRRAALSGDNGAWLKLGEPSVASFHHVMQRVACPYARSSVLLGAPVWDPELSPDTNILHCAYNLRRVAELNKSIDALDGVPDGMVMEVPIRQLEVKAKRTGEIRLVGCPVKVVANTSSDSSLQPFVGQEGVIVRDDGTSNPYKIRFKDGNEEGWFYKADVELLGG
jgi:nicotinic acid mononucleotide adenylyltransferase